MDSTKTAIKTLVLDLRKALEADIEIGLRRYGITATALRPLEALTHLDDRAKTARIRMEEALRHEMGRDPSTQNLAEAVHWFVREVAFTHLNRLVGLKALEVRGLTPEIIQTRPEYGERSRSLRDYRAAQPAAASLPDDGLEEAIKQACRQIYPEFRLLFDVGDPAEMRDAPVNSLVWPSTPTLKACIAKINALDEKVGRPGPPAHGKASPEHSLWAEDEIIGWIYQFYNAEEKVEIRKKGKPNHPAEVAVINQFFTPRWIVKFLVDNTLGRLWLEMHPDSQRVREKCDYLVPDPSPKSELLLGEGGEGARPAKRPQDIRLIDPACGTMHFGHYAFEVFQEMYAEARERGWVRGADVVSEADVPTAILQNNLFGVDIDLRAVQLAALSLFMKAKSANPDVRVGQVNLVVADAHLPQGRVREDFLAQYKSEPVIQKAFAEVFESLENVAEVGSLLRVEERFRQALAQAGHPSAGVPVQVKIDVYKGQMMPVRQAGFGDLAAAGWQPEYTVEQMLGHLREFARRALQEHDLNAQLFAGETEKSVALLDVFLHDYDVVVMNPPYGDTTTIAKAYLESQYPSSKSDLYTMFIDRALELAKNGYVGGLTSRTFMNLLSLEGFRQEVILGKTSFTLSLDLGYGILDDALVETSASVFCAIKSDKLACFIDLKEFDVEQKKSKFETQLQALKQATLGEHCFITNINDYKSIPSSSFAYSAPQGIIDLYKELSKLHPTYGNVVVGLQTSDDKRFLRWFWEINNAQKWMPYAKGGDFARYYYDYDLVVLWENNGEALRKFPKSYIRNERFYFTQGLSYPRSTVKGFNVRFLPKGHIWADIGPAILCKDENISWFLLGLLSSYPVEGMLDMTISRNFEVGFIRTIPIPNLEDKDIFSLAHITKAIYETKKSWDCGNEASTQFNEPWALLAKSNLLLAEFFQFSVNESTLPALIEKVLMIEDETNQKLRQMQEQIDNSAYKLYKISQKDREILEKRLGSRPNEIIWPYAERMGREQKATEHVARLMSYCLLGAIQADPDGILPLSEASGHASALRQVRAELEKHFGESAAYQVELDSAAYLGRPLGEWLSKNFWKDFHVKWYKNRPILWQLQSQKGHFACLVHIHKMDRDTLPKVRSQYLWPARNACQATLESARLREESGERAAAKEVAQLEAMLEDLSDFEKRLATVIEAKVKCAIPAWAQGPYRNGIYDPVLDDGVAVNILPLQEAGILAKGKVV